jgi:shikimate dehydrogenase
MTRTAVTRDRFLTGLIGRDIGATRSPWIHEGEADALGIRLAYTPLDFTVLGLDEGDLPRVLDAARLVGFSGVNITHPYKQSVMACLDALDPAAERIGAVNTVRFEAGRSIGHNTDYFGFLQGLRRTIPAPRCRHVVQLGAGGAGSATAQAILDHGDGVLTIVDPSDAHRAALVDRLTALYGAERVRASDDVAGALAGADGVVNATPIGMTGYPGSPLPAGALRSDLWVADVVYFPAETELLRDARAMGCDTLDGVAMVVFQAAAAFELFTGIPPDANRMLDRLRIKLEE